MSDKEEKRSSSSEGKSPSVEINIILPQASTSNDHGQEYQKEKTDSQHPGNVEGADPTPSPQLQEINEVAKQEPATQNPDNSNPATTETAAEEPAPDTNEPLKPEQQAEAGANESHPAPEAQQGSDTAAPEAEPKEVEAKHSEAPKSSMPNAANDEKQDSVTETGKNAEKEKTDTDHKTKEDEEAGNNAQEANEESQTHEDERPPDPPSTPTSRNVEAIQAALDSNKETGSGFIFSSQYEEGEDQDRRPPARESPEGGENTRVTKKLATTTVRFQTGVGGEDDKKKTYMTEPPEITERPTSRSQKLRRLNLSKPPEKFELRLQPPKQDPDPNNKAPLNPNVYVTELPREGGNVKTPFYMQVDIPNGCLDGRVRLKFEKQEFDRMKLGLSEDDMLCSYIVDLNMEPLAYCLRKNARVKMRILDKCVNKYEDTIIITARHFSWIRIPTKIESRSVNGEKHYYAVTDVQCLGKFAVINSKRMDRFVIAKAGGTFYSTIIPEISLKVDQGDLAKHKPQLIEMLVKDTREEAVRRINKEIGCISGVEGKLVAASPLIEITKTLMGQSAELREGRKFPKKLILNVPVPIPPKAQTKDGLPPNKSIVVVQRMMPTKFKTSNGHRYKQNAYGEGVAGLWEDVTEDSRLAVDGVAFEKDEKVSVKVTAPGKYMVLVFEESELDVKNAMEPDLHDLTSGINDVNQEFFANIMIHQNVSQPSLLFIHMVTSDAIQPIHETMRSTNAWKQVYVSKELIMHEWQPIRLEFKGDLQPTVNQMTPRIRFYSRRWQGYQIQMEATEEAYSAAQEEQLTGTISFVEESNDIQKKFSSTSVSSEEEQVLCDAEISLPHTAAKPFKPTVVIKPVPKASIYREYKMKWLQHMSQEEVERYKAAHGI